MSKKAISMLCAALMILGGLCGCQLADPKAGEESMQDRLIGFYVTTEYLDLYDMDAIIEDNIGTIMNGGTLDLTKENSQKLFATIKDVDIDGHKTIEYEFEGIEGIALILRIVEISSEIYSEVIAGLEVTDLKQICGDTTSIEGTIYVLAENNIVVYANPVYQTSDGQVYLVSGTGSSMSGGFGTFTQTMSENITSTVGDDTQQHNMTVIIHAEPRTKCDKTLVKQYGSNDEILSVTEITKNNIPEFITKTFGTEYIIVEYHGFSNSDENKMRREILQDGADYFHFYVLGDKGIFTPKYVEIK